ncbi:MAG: MBOAT family O-acyltransferase, partial [Bacteroidota bacterium]
MIINLGLLGTFKYSDFIIQNVNFLFRTDFIEPNILLPVGISFYTFQTLSYTIDVFKGEVKPEKNLIDFLMFVSLFPQLVAGPIVRYSEIALNTKVREVDSTMIYSGINRFCLGLFKKVVLANSIGILVEKYLNLQFDNLSTPESWYGIILYSLQLYFDFSGYSDMAIGLGRIFGFKFPENFRHPYAATSVANFYQRWHMTLGRFLRDYVYIPLGGNKKFQIRNILIVWFLTGLWHGASWNFVFWGLFLGIFMVIEKILKKYFDLLPRVALYAYALIVINFSRSFFYFDDFEKLSEFIQKLFYVNIPISSG